MKHPYQKNTRKCNVTHKLFPCTIFIVCSLRLHNVRELRHVSVNFWFKFSLWTPLWVARKHIQPRILLCRRDAAAAALMVCLYGFLSGCALFRFHQQLPSPFRDMKHTHSARILISSRAGEEKMYVCILKISGKFQKFPPRKKNVGSFLFFSWACHVVLLVIRRRRWGEE